MVVQRRLPGVLGFGVSANPFTGCKVLKALLRQVVLTVYTEELVLLRLDLARNKNTRALPCP